MNARNLGPFSLEGALVRLEPLRRRHTAVLFQAGRDLKWEWMLRPLRTRQAVEERIANGLKMERRGEEYAFAVILKNSNRIVGSTAYEKVSAKHRRAEIGSVWYAERYWGTAVNPECMYLLLRHAFEDWGAVRIQLGTDTNNLHSQRMILKLGARLEGSLRNHGIRPDGTVRDALLYSIIDEEWPEVKAKLLARIQRFGFDDGPGESS